MEQVASGRPADDAVDGQTDRAHAARPFRMASRTLNRETSEIDNEIRKMTPWILRNPRNIDGPAQMREILLLAA
jgi:hypothetical protein